MKADNIYKYLHLFLQNATINIFGYFWQKRRFGGVFDRELLRFKEREKLTKQQWREYQTQELRIKFLECLI